MKKKKIILKTIFLFPIGFALYALISRFNIDHWDFSIIAGFVFALGIVYWNIFDYDKYEQMESTDYLESKHNMTLKNNIENWNRINELIKNQFFKFKILKKTENSLKVQIDQKYIGSILTIKKSHENIILVIEKRFLTFLPDNAQNYRILQKLNRGLKTIANTE